MDGANKRQQLIYITLPQLRNALIFVVLVTTILAFRLFDQVQIMTRFVLPFEIVSVLLLAAMIGAIVIAAKERRREDEDAS